jgi:RNA polymerase-binding transcription factor DksA
MHYHYFTLEQRNALSDLIHSRATEPGMSAALERLRTPAFGVCEACGGDIPFIRLMGNPRLQRCPRCHTAA